MEGSGSRLVSQQTRGLMLRSHFDKRRIDFFATIDGDWAARMEAAARRDVERIRCFPLQDDALAAFARIGRRHHGKKRLRVGMLRIAQYVARRSDLDDAP